MYKSYAKMQDKLWRSYMTAMLPKLASTSLNGAQFVAVGTWKVL
jgi:hypothetical protein